ncbi:MAG: dTDP-glucose 4,6-dehydratase [Chthonomonadales bacterium]
MSTVLVTGGAGFIGSHFVQHWLERHPGDRVVVLDALTYAGNLANLAHAQLSPQFRFYPGLIQDPVAVRGIFQAEKPQFIVNFAAMTHNDRSLLDPAGFIQTNTAGVNILLETTREFGVERFLHVSTDEVYGEALTGSFKETDPLRPRTPYAASKAGGDLLALAHHVAYGTPVLITRGSNTYGPRQYPEKLLPFFITRAIRNKKLPLYGAGDQVREWIHVEDHCRGIAWVLEHGTSGEVYNLGGGNECTNLQITERILSVLNKPRDLIFPIPDPRGDAHDRRYSLDTSKLSALGWRPEVDFNRGLEDTIRWYAEHEDWWRPILSTPEYVQFVTRFYGPFLGEDL